MVKGGEFIMKEDLNGERGKAAWEATKHMSLAYGLGGLLVAMAQDQPGRINFAGMGNTFEMAATLMGMESARVNGAEDPVSEVALKTGLPVNRVVCHLQLAQETARWLLEKTQKAHPIVENIVDK